MQTDLPPNEGGRPVYLLSNPFIKGINQSQNDMSGGGLGPISLISPRPHEELKEEEYEDEIEVESPEPIEEYKKQLSSRKFNLFQATFSRDL